MSEQVPYEPPAVEEIEADVNLATAPGLTTG
jgi:hypothetical protein